MTIRSKAGTRRHSASFYRFDGTQDDLGQPAYEDPDNWIPWFEDWRCEFKQTVGGEIIRGRMITEKSTAVLFGHFRAVEGLSAADRCVINGVNYGITSVSDEDGMRMVMRVELREEK